MLKVYCCAFVLCLYLQKVLQNIPKWKNEHVDFVTVIKAGH